MKSQLSRSLLFGFLVLLFSTQNWSFKAQGSDAWPMYGHDPLHSNRSSANGPNTPDLKWTYTAAGAVRSPVIAEDGSLYFGIYDPDPGDQLIALNPNGTLKWAKPGGFADRFDHVALGADGTIYANYENGLTNYLIAVDPVDGDTLWDFTLGDTTYGAPIVGPDGTIYVTERFSGTNNSGAAYAINPNGTQKWKWNSGTANCSTETTPALAPNGNLYLQHNCMGLVALNSLTGALLWDIGGGAFGQLFNSPSVGTDNIVYIGSSDHLFRAFNPDSTLKWDQTVENWMYSTTNTHSADGSTVYRGDNGGILYAFDTATGDIRWTYDINIPGTGITSSAALAGNGIIYFTTSDTTGTPDDAHGYLYALRADKGKLLWQYEIGFTSSDPAIGPDGTLYIPGDTPEELGTGNLRMLYAFECEDNLCPLPKPAAPTNLAAASLSSNSIGLTWTDNAGDETTYRVERSDNGIDNWITAKLLPVNSQSYTDESVVCQTTYHYRVFAVDGDVDSLSSNIANAAAGSCPAPGEFVLQTPATGAIMRDKNVPLDLTWKPASNAFTYTFDLIQISNNARLGVIRSDTDPANSLCTAVVCTKTLDLSGFDSGLYLWTVAAANPAGQREAANAGFLFSVNDNAIDLIENGGFETAGATAKAAQNWKAKKLSGERRRCGGSGDLSDCAFSFKGSAGENSRIFQTVQSGLLQNLHINAADTLILRARVKSGNLAAGASVRVTLTRSSGPQQIVNFEIPLATNGSYTDLNTTPIIPEGAVIGIRVEIRYKNPLAAGRFTIDDVQLSLLPVAAGGLLPLPSEPDDLKQTQ